MSITAITRAAEADVRATLIRTWLVSNLSGVAMLAAQLADLYEADHTVDPEGLARLKGDISGKLLFCLRNADRLIGDERALGL